MKSLLSRFAAVLLVTAAPSVSRADAVADFYKDKIVRVTISGEVGGTNDSTGVSSRNISASTFPAIRA